MRGMKRPLYRRCLVLAICASLALVVLPIVAMAAYYLFALKRGFHPDAGLGNFVLAAEEVLPAGAIAFKLIALGVCVFPLSAILLAANIVAARIECSGNHNKLGH